MQDVIVVEMDRDRVAVVDHFVTARTFIRRLFGRTPGLNGTFFRFCLHEESFPLKGP